MSRLHPFAPFGTACLLGALLPAPAEAQGLPAEPITLAGGSIVVSGSVSAAIGSRDQPGYFDYTDYEHTPLRLFRVDAMAAWYPNDHIGVLTEFRSENLEAVKAYAWYVRVRPWATRPVDVQLGRIPPAFGAYARRAYGTDDPFIGYPLAYQYLTTVRGDALPATSDSVLRQRGRGWRVSYPIGDQAAGPGLPLVSAFRWDTGVQVRVGDRPVQASLAVTQGTLSRPRVEDDNAGKQVSGRLAWYPTVGLILGVSAARGAFVSDAAARALPQAARLGTSTQTAFGIDAEYSRGHWLLRGEAITNAWSVPAVDAPAIEDPLRAAGAWVEGRYRVSPRLYLAGRADHLSFSRLTGTLFASQPTTWDAPVTRGQVVVGVYLRRNVVARGEYQYNWRDGGRPRERGLTSVQLLYWF